MSPDPSPDHGRITGPDHARPARKSRRNARSFILTGTANRVGEVLDGRYEIVRLLGKGGMGEVYVARHRHIGKDVAVKFLRRDLTSDDDAVTRIQLEARAAAAVGHRGIVDVYDVGTAGDGAPYIVMELLEGESLRAMLDREKVLPLERVLAIVSELLSALVVAHAKGIVHRDLKPDNVFLERTDGPLSVKLLDFGIAKMTEGAGVNFTRTGMPIGTAPYMSPEQARGVRDPDARVDVYAAGVLLYEALSGHLPFESDSYNEIIVKILREDAPALRSYRSDLPEAVEAIVMRALEKDPARRFASAADLLAALKALGVGIAETASPVSPRALEGAEVAPVAATARPTPHPNPSPLRGEGLYKRSLLFVGAVAIAVAALVIASTSGGSNTPARRPRERPAVVEKAPAPAPAHPRVVTIAVEGIPDGARVFFDGALVSELPVRVEPREAMVPLRIEAPGFATHSQMVSASRDTTVRVSLVAEPQAPQPARPTAPHHKRATSSPTSTKIQTDTREFEQ